MKPAVVHSPSPAATASGGPCPAARRRGRRWPCALPLLPPLAGLVLLGSVSTAAATSAVASAASSSAAAPAAATAPAAADAQAPPAAAAPVPPAPSEPESGAPAELKKLSIEELMEIDVTSVSKRTEKLSAAAAAITVITGDDIRRSGVTNLPDALRLATGLQVAQADGHTWAVSARGFNNTAADKLLVLIDGRSVYTPLFGGVFWDVQQTFLPDIDRIEVIRGPGGTLWGANAVNGVINVITRGAAETQGGIALAGAGLHEPGFGSLRYGDNLGEGLNYRVYAKYLYDPALAFAGGASAGDPLRLGQGGFRLDGAPSTADAYTVQGDLYSGLAGQPASPDANLGGLNLLGRWSHRLAADSDLSLQLYFDHTHRLLPAVFEEHRDTFDLDFQHHLLAGPRHEVVWGVGYRASADRIADTAVISWVPDRRRLDLVEVFAQDEIVLVPGRLHLTVGSKVEYDTFAHLEAEPSVRLAWTPSERRALWAAISRAVRIPTQLDEDSRFTSGSTVILAGSHSFDSEAVIAYELGYRAQPWRGLSVDLAAFYNSYDHLRTEEPTASGNPVLVIANNLKGTSFGGEASVNYQATPWWRWYAGYSGLHKDLRLEPGSRDPTAGQAEGNDPADQWSLRSSLDLPRQVELDAWLRRVDRLPAPVVPAYTEMDVRLGWRPLARLELALVGRNLLHARHPEFGPPSPFREEVQRTVYGKVEWHF